MDKNRAQNNEPYNKIFFLLGAKKLIMNNLDNYFELVIMGEQVCKLDQILNSK
jgi:hypothetical protein